MDSDALDSERGKLRVHAGENSKAKSAARSYVSIKNKSDAFSELKREIPQEQLEGYEVLNARNKQSYRFKNLLLNDESKIFGIETKYMRELKKSVAKSKDVHNMKVME